METRERDLERLIPMHKSGASPRDVVLSVPPSPLASPIHVAGKEAIYKVIRSWASKKFINQKNQSSGAFKEVAIIRHPHMGEYAFGFITSTVILRGRAGGEELCCVYVPTNHLYLGDIFLISSKDIIRPNLSVREGIEIVISGGMSIPQMLTTLDSETIHRSVVGTFAIPPV